MAEKSIVDALVADPSEGLAVEVKRWIDPSQPTGIAKIAKGTMALRNRNGGYFVIGFDDASMIPDLAGEPPKARELFHVDTIQAIISKYASDQFEIAVVWSERDGRQYPVIVVPSGVKVPVAAKRELRDGAQTLIRKDAVYFRSMSANGTASTTEAKASDWTDILDICFDNREADVGRFIRRHLSGVDLGPLVSFLGTAMKPVPTLCERADKVIDAGELRFAEVVKQRKLSPDEAVLFDRAFWSASLVIDPPRAGATASQEFLDRLAASNPRYTGWPVWMDARSKANPENRPKVVKGTFEYLIVSPSQDFGDHVDFARLNPNGEFFLHRMLQDDGVPPRVRPGTVLDPTLMILRIAEVMAVGMAFARSIGCVPDKTTLGFAFRWHKLEGRRLNAWADPEHLLRDGGVAYDGDTESCVQFSLDTPSSTLVQFVEDATQPLFAAFEGTTVPRNVFNYLVRKLVERKL